MRDPKKEVEERMKHDREVFDKNVEFSSLPVARCPQCSDPQLLRHNVDAYYCKNCNRYYRVKISQEIEDLDAPETQSSNK